MFAKQKNKSDEEDVTNDRFETMTAAADEGASKSASSGFLLERNKPSVISEGFSLVGDITADGALHVEGQVRGTVKTNVVNIGQNGSVEGKVSCRSLQIKGTFLGEADCDELLIAGKARVTGRVTYKTLSVQRGAEIDGTLVRVQ